jgi:hypothetical protein
MRNLVVGRERENQGEVPARPRRPDRFCRLVVGVSILMMSWADCVTAQAPVREFDVASVKANPEGIGFLTGDFVAIRRSVPSLQILAGQADQLKIAPCRWLRVNAGSGGPR